MVYIRMLYMGYEMAHKRSGMVYMGYEMAYKESGMEQTGIRNGMYLNGNQSQCLRQNSPKIYKVVKKAYPAVTLLCVQLVSYQSSQCTSRSCRELKFCLEVVCTSQHTSREAWLSWATLKILISETNLIKKTVPGPSLHNLSCACSLYLRPCC